MIDISEVKLVIWDLDDTFWNGTLAEGSASVNEDNRRIAEMLIDKGIMNSICSKNDFATTQSFLEKNNLAELFVFPSINWNAKAPRLQAIIKAMGLRPANVLFIDDNDINLNEARYFLPDLMTLNASELNAFSVEVEKCSKSDPQHKRLKQYRILERKAEAMHEAGSNEEFLKDSDIRVIIDKDCLREVDRISEMIERTNQLNYTKLRSSAKDVKAIIESPDFECGLVRVSDKYGDYGIVGFFAVEKNNGSLLHFLFSCRTLGMRIEQWVYEQLGFPKLTVVGEIAAEVEPRKIVTWVNCCNEKQSHSVDNSGIGLDLAGDFRVLLKGPCDLSAVVAYLGEKLHKHITAEFNYVNDSGVSITAFNTSTHILGASVNDRQLKEVLADAPFLDSDAWKSTLLTAPWNIVFQSLLPDCHEGQYVHRKTGIRITFSSGNYNLCDSAAWDKFISGEYTNHGFKFTREILKKFSDEFEFVGFIPAEEIVDNWTELRKRLPSGTVLIFMLGSTLEYESACSGEFSGHAERHRVVNELMKHKFADDPMVRFIEYDRFISSQSDYGDCINHFQRSIYRQIASAIVDEINTVSSAGNFKTKSGLRLLAQKVLNRVKRVVR